MLNVMHCGYETGNMVYLAEVVTSEKMEQHPAQPFDVLSQTDVSRHTCKRICVCHGQEQSGKAAANNLVAHSLADYCAIRHRHKGSSLRQVI